MSGQLQKCWVRSFWNLFWLVPGICCAITCLEISSWAFLNFYPMWLHRTLCIQMDSCKKKNEYNNLLKLSRRERKDSSGAFWSMSFLHLGPERRGASVDTFPRNQKDGLELASFHYKSWTVHQQSCSESRSLIFPCTLWFQGRTMFRPYERVPIMPQKNPIIKWRARFQLVKFHLGVTKNKKTTTEQKLNVST